MKKIITEKNGRVRVMTLNELPSMTEQQFVAECDVNNIIARYKKTNEWTHLSGKQQIFADVSEITDYQSSLQKISDAQNAFNSLPSHLRNRFENDPQNMLDFLQDPSNYHEGVKLGIFNDSSLYDPSNNDNLNDDKGSKKSSKQSQSTSQKTSSTSGAEETKA